MTVYIAVGPTISAAQALGELPEAVVIPPVQAGSLICLPTCVGDTVAIIDGVFREQGAVRHKEILALLAEGVRVVGASSMGALRAAEMAPFGMEGVGKIYRLFADGVIDGDDEVAVLHGPPPDYRDLTIALVNLRVGLSRAIARGAVNTVQASAVIAAAKSLPFMQRTVDAITQAIDDAHATRDGADQAASIDQLVYDQKRADALELISRVATGSYATRPRRKNGLHYRTRHYERLRLAVPHALVEPSGAVSDFDLLNAARVLDNRFPAFLEQVAIRTIAALEARALGAEAPADDCLLSEFLRREDVPNNEAAFAWLDTRRLTETELLEALRDKALADTTLGVDAVQPGSDIGAEIVIRHMARRQLIERTDRLPAQWLQLLTPEEHNLPVRDQLLKCCARGFHSLHSRRYLVRELKLSAMLSHAQEQAALANQLLHRAAMLRPEIDPTETPLSMLRDWAASLWHIPVNLWQWNAMDRGFLSDAAFIHAAAPHHLVAVISAGLPSDSPIRDDTAL